ncbi:winged helix-turn-helix domain-containing protein [Rickettsia endosymbiont of Halotydeus destructor]|uniref:winged helix-turn-helix domain-containing protein n=1 Tax=Rickettsia endosymbiont of Halotydeus destructor TaxID=2996754 RepID=UPI003BAEE669
MLDKLLPQILIVELKETINVPLYNIIERAGFDIIKANTLEQALSGNIIPTIIIIGVQPTEPKMIITAIRKVEALYKIPIIFLSTPEKIVSNQLQVNNLISFLPKPFSSDQLLNMIKNLLRRSKPILQDNLIKFKNINIDINTQKLYKNGKIVRIGPTEFKILHLFLQFPTTIFSRQKIMEYLGENNKDYNSRIIDVHINRIRKALKDTNGEEELIKTVRFFGYCLELPNSESHELNYRRRST